jgi:hypothetical protein
MKVQTRMIPPSTPYNQRSGHIRITQKAGEPVLIKSAEGVTTHWEKLPKWLTHQLNAQDEKKLSVILGTFAKKDNVILDLHPTHNAELKVFDPKHTKEEQVAFFPWLTDVQNKEKSTFRRDNGRALYQIRPAIITAMSEASQKRNYSAYGHTPQVPQSIEKVLSDPAYQAIYGEPVEKVAPLPVSNVTINPNSSQGVNAVTNPHQSPVAILTPSGSGAEALQSPGVLIKEANDLFGRLREPVKLEYDDGSYEAYPMAKFFLKMLEQKLGRGAIPKNLQYHLNGYKSQMESSPNDLDKLYALLTQCMDKVFPKIVRDRENVPSGLPIENLVTPEHPLYQKLISPSIKNKDPEEGFEEESLERNFKNISKNQKRKYQTTRP